MPRIRSSLVPRPHLIQKLNRGLHHKLTLISGPAGFGKTTLVADFGKRIAEGAAVQLCWLSLDKEDKRNGRFFHYLIAALQKADHTIGHEVVHLMKASPQLPPDLVLTSLINDLDAVDQKICLILDDYHLIKSQAVHDAVTFLLDHSPSTFHLVIAGRSDPPLPLARLRARGQMVELRAADLRFSESEAAQFLIEIMGLHLDDASIVALAKRTEGWIAGLQMAALTMQHHDDISGFVAGFSGTNRYILDYLLEEVLAHEPEAVQTFLLQSAVLTRLSGPLCDAVTGVSGSQEMLEQLERRNLFVVPLDDKRLWYRYHHLFADLLQARLQQTAPEQVAPLLSRAAAWCERNGQVTQAVEYALAAQDFKQAANLVEKHWGNAVTNGEVETIWAWLNALPEHIVKERAPLAIAYCWVLWFRGEIGRTIAAYLAAAEQAMNAAVEPDNIGLNAQFAVLSAFVSRYHGEFEIAISLTKQALSLLPENLPTKINALLHSMIYLAQASAYDGAGNLGKAVSAYTETIRWSRLSANAAGVAGITYRLVGALRLLGRLREADTACREALVYMQAQGMARLPTAGILHLAMSEVLLEQNELAAAEAHLAQGIELGKWSGRLDAARNAAPVLARLRLVHGEVGEALTAVQEAESALPKPPSTLAQAELLALKARILVRQGSRAEAARTASEAVQLAGDDRGQTGQLAALAASRVLLAQYKPDEAIARLTQLLAVAEENGRLGIAIELLILQSLAQMQRGATLAAKADLEHALALAKPQGYVRIFLDEGQPMRLLLTQWLANANNSQVRDYAAHLLAQFDVDPSPVGSLVEPLSPRELEVLQLIALGKTNKEIARQLVISPGTVKAHTASIYRKLDVANRTEAVTRARELGILA